MRDHTCTEDCTAMPFRYQLTDEVTVAVGDRVTFLAERLGVLLQEDDGQFVGTLGRDFVGIYHGPHPSPRLEGWHLVTVPPIAVEPANDGCAELIHHARKANARLFVPVHASQIAPCR
jgi:hypothetical protein